MKNEKKVLACVGISLAVLTAFGWHDTTRLAEAAPADTVKEIVIEKSERKPEITPAAVAKAYTEFELLETKEPEKGIENADSKRAGAYGTGSNSVAGDSEVEPDDEQDSGNAGGDDTAIPCDTGSDYYFGWSEDMVGESIDVEYAVESMPELVESGADDAAEYGSDAESGSNGNLSYLGIWTITAYCPCEICCGEWATGCTASGVLATSNHTVACGSLPFGTQVMIGDQIYTVEDTGVEGEWIDIFFDTHDEALAFGMRMMEVYLVE